MSTMNRRGRTFEPARKTGWQAHHAARLATTSVRRYQWRPGHKLGVNKSGVKRMRDGVENEGMTKGIRHRADKEGTDQELAGVSIE